MMMWRSRVQTNRTHCEIFFPPHLTNNRHSSAGIETALTVGVRFLSGVRDFFLLHSVQTGSVVYPASYLMGKRDCFPRDKEDGAGSWLFNSKIKQDKSKTVPVLNYLLFKPEDRGKIFFRNIGWLSTDYTALYSSRQNSSAFKNLGLSCYVRNI
jgi:hypothetical protein